MIRGTAGRAFTEHEDRKAARSKAPQHIGAIIPNVGIVTAPSVGLNTTPDPRARPEPECECPLCGATVDQLVQCYRWGKFTMGCYACGQKKHCFACDKYVDSVEFVEIGKNTSQMQCVDCRLAPALRETAPAPESYCVACFCPFEATRPHQRRCAGCAETIAAQWAAVPPTPKPPKLVLVMEPERLAPMVLWRAMWLQVWADWQRAHNPMVLIRQMDRNIKAGPGVAKATTAPWWESKTSAELAALEAA